VDWGGVFAQVEYSGKKWSAFLTGSGSMTYYQRLDYFKKRDVVLDDGTVVPQIVGYNEVYYTNGTQSGVAQNNAVITTSGDTTIINNPSGADYKIVNAKGYAWNSDKARTAQTDRKSFPGFTVKTGANYNFTDHLNAFVNIGYLVLAPRFNTVFDNNNKEIPGVKSQVVFATEIGVGVRYPKFAVNFNAYNTDWKNKPPYSSPTVTIASDQYTYDMTGLNTTLKGIEVDFSVKPLETLELMGMVSIGDWTYHSSGVAYLYDANYVLTDTIAYSAKGVHVGDAAQTMFSGSARWEMFRGFYIKPRYTYFANHYANFDPIYLTPVYNSAHQEVGDNRDHESWKIPAYGLLDLFAGYEFSEKVGDDHKIKLAFNLGVTNLLNTFYISDATNGANYDAASVLIYPGLGRRWTAGMRLMF
ncbi:MAG TPA: TonB-dependent receptor, partial [Bacteroidia bacterium]|nr:TonB-dependent receptor [Bacteroidia bacterium]